MASHKSRLHFKNIIISKFLGSIDFLRSLMTSLQALKNLSTWFEVGGIYRGLWYFFNRGFFKICSATEPCPCSSEFRILKQETNFSSSSVSSSFSSISLQIADSNEGENTFFVTHWKEKKIFQLLAVTQSIIDIGKLLPINYWPI